MNENISKIREILHRAGWSDEYQIDIHKYLVFLVRDKWSVSNVTQTLLRKFGGIEIRSDEQLGRYYLNFDPIAAANYNSRWFFEEVEIKLGKELCPIALMHNGLMVVLIDDTGDMYIFDDGVLFYATNNVFDVVYIACSQPSRKLTRLFETD